MKDFISRRTLIILLSVAAFATIAMLVLFAYAPDIRNSSSSGNNALSDSAIGFAGLKELLDLSGIPAGVDRTRAGHATPPSLIIVTPDVTTSPTNLWDYISSADAPVLIILPKWETVPLPFQAGWVMKAGPVPPAIVARLIANVAPLRVTQWPGDTKHIALSSPYAIVATPAPLSSIEQLQTVAGRGETLLAVSDRSNAPLLLSVRRGKREFHILSEPDVMNNHGLSDQAAERTALAIITGLRVGKGPVLLDVTLNGLGSTPNLLRAMFEVPFRGATICAFLAALLMALHALARFGAPEREPEAERGKKALADNTAGLVRMMDREGAMARRYVQAARDLALARLGGRRGTVEEQDILIAGIERNTAPDTPYSRLAAEAITAKDGDDLTKVAAKAYAWRIRITGEQS